MGCLFFKRGGMRRGKKGYIEGRELEEDGKLEDQFLKRISISI